jgi:hypothetical protein
MQYQSRAEHHTARSDEVEPPRAVADVVAGTSARDAAKGGLGIYQAAEAHRRMPNLKAGNVDTPQFQGHVFEQMATDAQNARHPLHRWKLNVACNEAATDATAADGTKLQMKKGNGQSDGPRTEAHLRGRRNNNRMIQKLGLDKLDRVGHESGRVVTTKGDRVLEDPRVVESPVSRARVEQATERYAQALQGLSRQDLARLAGQGAKEGALIGGGLSAGFAVYGMVTGALEWDEAAEQVVIGTAAAALGGAAGKVVAGILEAASASAGDGAAVIAPRIGQVLGHAGIVGVAVCGVANTAINGYAVVKGDKALDAAVRDTAKGTAFGAAGVGVAAGVATIGAVAAAPATVTVVVVVGAATATTVLAEQGFNRARNRLFGDPRRTAFRLVTAAEAELVDAVAEYEGVSVIDLLDRLGLDPAQDDPKADTA